MKKAKQNSASLAKSHAKRSNTKLMFLGMLAALAFGGLVSGLGLYKLVSEDIFVLILAAFAALNIFCLFLFAKFKR